MLRILRIQNLIMKYKYHLDKSSKKFVCPSCNKKTFVKYLDGINNNYLEASLGRCDRESKCQYHNTPKGNKTIVPISGALTQKKKASYHSLNVVGSFARNYSNNNFITYLRRFFVKVDIKKAIKKYFIGTSSHWSGATVFWQLDECYNGCAGKVMLYDKNTGARIKNPYPHINWMHKVLNEKQFTLQQCLFGLHLISEYKNYTIGLVESEKTAVIMSVLNPSILWLATGSKTNLKEQLLKPIKHFNIVAYPDKTEYIDWNNKIANLQKKGFKIRCSDLLEQKNLEEGDDLVDLLLKYNNAA
jgi:Domain of unknown function (DUF6371)/Zinc beta-ribbon finger, putative